jgi:hypothetical protein
MVELNGKKQVSSAEQIRKTKGKRRDLARIVGVDDRRRPFRDYGWLYLRIFHK